MGFTCLVKPAERLRALIGVLALWCVMACLPLACVKNTWAATGELAQNSSPPKFTPYSLRMTQPPATIAPAAGEEQQPQPALQGEEMPAQEVAPVIAVPPEATVEEAVEEGEGYEDEDYTPKVIEKQGPNGKITYVERPEDSKLILELVLDDRVTVLSSELETWQVKETVLVPLGKFAELVRFPIKVDAASGTADGWFLNPDNKFHLAYPYNFAEIGGKKIEVKTGIAETHTDDIYISIELLAVWFPVELTLNYNELRLYMKTLKDLPFEAEAKRKAAWEAVQKAQARQPGLDYDPKDVIKLPYRMYAAPVIQLSHGINHLSTPLGASTATSSSLNAQTDLLGMSARFAANYQTSTTGREQITGINMNLSREDYDANLLGPLRATRFEMGDITTDAFPLAGQQSGRGGIVTNQPYNFVSDANNFRIRGFGPADWDIEVFQDNELLAFGRSGPDGSYAFDSLPLSDGFNLFKIIFYGPNGEQEVKYERFYLGQNMVPPGDFYYSAALLQSSTPVLDVSASPPGETTGTVSLQGEYGVTKYLSAMAGYYRGPTSTTPLNGLGFGLRSSGGSAYAQVNAFFDESGGQSSSGLVTGNLNETTTFNINHTRHMNYDTGVYPTQRRTSAQLSKLFNLNSEIIPSINATLGVAREDAESGQVKTAYTNRLSTAFLGLALTNELEVDHFDDGTATLYSGTFTGRYRSSFGHIQGTLTYTPHPWELLAGSLNLQKDISERLAINAGIGHTFGITPLTTLTGSLDYKFDKIRVGLAGSMDSNETKQIGLTLTYSLVPQGLYGDYMMTGRTDDLNTGRLVIRPFEDRNGNGIWEAGEPLVQDVAFRNLLRGGASAPGPEGLVNLGGLTPNLANRITIDDKSLTDLSLAPAKKQMVVLGKAGVHGPIDYPFTKSGNITGKLLYANADGADAPLENIRMVLLDTDGKSVADTYSEYDGYFGFEDIKMGAYEIFFPDSQELKAHYSGNGEGPKVVLDFERPEVSELVLKIQGSEIIALSQPEASVPKPEQNETSKPPVSKSNSEAPQLSPMPMNTNIINEISPVSND